MAELHLRYHRMTFEMLGRRPRWSAQAERQIEACERECRRPLPASIRERYCLHPSCVPEHLFPSAIGLTEILKAYRNTFRVEARGGPPRLYIGCDGGAWEWYVSLDGSDDPPVIEVQYSDEPPLLENCGPFSSLFFYQAWWDLHHHYLHRTRQCSLQATDRGIGPMELDYLRDHFLEGQNTRGWWLFFGEGAWIQVTVPVRPDQPSTLYLFARSEKRLREVIRILWPVASLRETLTPGGAIARKALETVRREFRT